MEKKSKIGRKIVVILIAFTMLFSVAMFVGCTNDNSELLNELAQLRELLEEKSGLSQQLQELTELVNGMKEDNDGLAEKIEALQGGIDALTKRLGGLEASNGYLLGMIGDLQEQVEELKRELENMKNNENEQGAFFTMQEAYDEGFITVDAIKHIAYFNLGIVFEEGGLVEIPFKPQIPRPDVEDLNVKIKTEMKNVFYDLHRQRINENLEKWIAEGFLSAGTCPLTTISIRSFWGKFNESYAVQITSFLWDYIPAPLPVIVTGIEWEESPPFTLIFTRQQTK